MTKGNKRERREGRRRKGHRICICQEVGGGAVTHKVVSNLVSSLVKDSWVSSAVREKGDWLFTNSFTQQTFIECLLCVKHGVAKWRKMLSSFVYLKDCGLLRVKSIEKCHRLWLLE